MSYSAIVPSRRKTSASSVKCHPKKKTDYLA